MEQVKIGRLGNEATIGLGRFSCLPNELFMSILDRIHDLKCLFQCTLVSEDFAKNIYCVNSISLKLPATGASTNICHLFGNELRAELEKPRVSSPPSRPSQELKFIEFLKKFTKLEFAFFESPCPVTPCSSPSIRWKVRLGGNSGFAVGGFISVLPSTMCLESEVESESESGVENESGSGEEDGEEDEDEDDDDEGEDSEEEEGEGEDDEDEDQGEDGEDEEGDDDDEGEDSEEKEGEGEDDEDEDQGEDSEDEEGDDEEEVPEYPRHLAEGCLLSLITSFAEWFDIMFSLIKHHQTLKSVICTDSGKHGKIVLNAKQIVEWRKGLVSGELSHIVIPKTIVMGRVPSTDLPLPGCRIKRGSHVFLTFYPTPKPTNAPGTVEGWEYDEEDKVIEDAMGRLFTMNPDCIFYVTSPY